MVKRFYIFSKVDVIKYYDKEDADTLIKDFVSIIQRKDKKLGYRAIGVELNNGGSFDLIMSLENGEVKASNDIRYSLARLNIRDKCEVSTYANEVVIKAKELISDLCLENYLRA